MIFLYKFPGSVQKDLSQEASSSKPIAQSIVLASKDVSGNVNLLPFGISIVYCSFIQTKHSSKAGLQLLVVINWKKTLGNVVRKGLTPISSQARGSAVPCHLP